MKKIAASIRTGAQAYLKRQYTIVSVFFVGMFVILCIMAACKLLTWLPCLSLSSPAASSPALSGFIGMTIATRGQLPDGQRLPG